MEQIADARDVAQVVVRVAGDADAHGAEEASRRLLLEHVDRAGTPEPDHVRHSDPRTFDLTLVRLAS